MKKSMPDKPLYLLGAGGHGSVVLNSLLECGMTVTAILDSAWPSGHRIFGVPVAGSEAFLNSVQPESVALVNGVGTLPGKDARIVLYRRWQQRGFEFASFAHPSVVMGREVTLAGGSQIMAGTVLQCRASVAENAVINTRASIDHDCRISAHAFIGPGVVLCGGVFVGEAAFIGAGAVVLPGISIGNGSIVGAGAVVNRAVSDGALVMGNPARAAAQQS
jgi:sugar O-acyltransferase (sialic acid O-acetyltransferase NeuD family)